MKLLSQQLHSLKQGIYIVVLTYIHTSMFTHTYVYVLFLTDRIQPADSEQRKKHIYFVCKDSHTLGKLL